MPTTIKTVGRFSLVRDDDGAVRVSGPAEYLASPAYADCIAKIERGGSAIVNSGFAPDVETAILVAIQTDFAGWLGMREMELRCRARREALAQVRA